MNCCKCDIKKHNLKEIAELIYKTEPELSKMLFGKNKTKANKRIIKLIKNNSNSFTYKNIVLAYENDKVLGILVGYRGKDINKDKENKAISNSLFLRLLERFPFLEILLNLR